MSSKGTGHRKTKKHHSLNEEHYERMKGVIPLNLSNLKRLAKASDAEPAQAVNTYYCEKCKYHHKIDSKVGILHKGEGHEKNIVS